MAALLAALQIEQAAAPMIMMLLSIIKSHVNATGQMPDEAAIIAAVPVGQQTLKDLWGSWTATHPKE